MKLKDVENDLLRRVDEPIRWFQSGEALAIDGLEARNTPCTAAAIELINDKDRKESDGIKFRLVFGKSELRMATVVEVRIKASPSAEGDGSALEAGPYVALYIVDSGKMAAHLSCWFALADPNSPLEPGNDTIQEWYQSWLRRLLNRQKGTTVFTYMQSLSQ